LTENQPNINDDDGNDYDDDDDDDDDDVYRRSFTPQA